MDPGEMAASKKARMAVLFLGASAFPSRLRCILGNEELVWPSFPLWFRSRGQRPLPVLQRHGLMDRYPLPGPGSESGSTLCLRAL